MEVRVDKGLHRVRGKGWVEVLSGQRELRVPVRARGGAHSVGPELNLHDAAATTQSRRDLPPSHDDLEFRFR